MDENQRIAIEAYTARTGRDFVPGDVVEIPVDALLFDSYQEPWVTLDEFKEERCIYDEETNDWLVNLVTDVLLQPEIPPIYVDVLSEGYALVDGCHRTSAALIAGRSTVKAHLNSAYGGRK